MLTLLLVVAAAGWSSIFAFQDSLEAVLPASWKPKIYLKRAPVKFDYIRQEVTFVDYVRDQGQADIYILVTRQRTGSRGREYTLTFGGQNQFAGVHDTLTYYANSFDTAEKRRSAFVRVFKQGLYPYLHRTPLGRHFDLVYLGGEDEQKEQEDGWNYWVSRVRISGNVNGEKQQSSFSFYGSIRTDRITEEWKLRFGAFMNYDENSYEFDEESLTSFDRRYRFSSTAVKSVSGHMSLGFFSQTGSSTFENIRFETGAYLAGEFNVFPYVESTRKSLRFTYVIGLDRRNYHEITIYDKLNDLVYKQNLDVKMEIRQLWGEVDAFIGYSNHLSDFSRSRITSKGYLSLRLLEGVSFEIGAGHSAINDQISIPQRDLSIDEILLQRRELETRYSFWASIGFSYTFGSIYNNIVNPRFDD